MRILSILTLLLSLTACATPYQPRGPSGGYSSTRLDANVWIVNFRGNGFTGQERAQDYALLRAAELARQNGYKYFIIQESEKRTALSTHTTPKVETKNTSSGGRTRTVTKPIISLTIEGYKEKPSGFFYNAEFLSQSIKSKYRF